MSRRPDPLSLLNERIESLRDAAGLYAAGPLREFLDGDPDDPDQITRQAWIGRLTQALAGVFDASTRAFGSVVYSDDGDVWFCPGALAGWLKEQERYARIDGLGDGVRLGYERGATDVMVHESAPPAPGTMTPERALEVLRRRPGKTRLEAWERYLW